VKPLFTWRNNALPLWHPEIHYRHDQSPSIPTQSYLHTPLPCNTRSRLSEIGPASIAWLWMFWIDKRLMNCDRMLCFLSASLMSRYSIPVLSRSHKSQRKMWDDIRWGGVILFNAFPVCTFQHAYHSFAIRHGVYWFYTRDGELLRGIKLFGINIRSLFLQFLSPDKYYMYKNNQMSIQINDTYSDTTNPIFETEFRRGDPPPHNPRRRVHPWHTIIDGHFLNMQALLNPASTDMHVYK
jgi:hypothetical protein